VKLLQPDHKAFHHNSLGLCISQPGCMLARTALALLYACTSRLPPDINCTEPPATVAIHNTLRCLHVRLQGIEGHGFYGNCVVPIIENTARECELTDRMRQAIQDYPQANAVLVRRHGG
jgi:hypothetical protein